MTTIEPVGFRIRLASLTTSRIRACQSFSVILPYSRSRLRVNRVGDERVDDILAPRRVAGDDLRWAEGGGPADDAEVVRCQADLTDTGKAS
jgi:hypothetical protein